MRYPGGGGMKVWDEQSFIFMFYTVWERKRTKYVPLTFPPCIILRISDMVYDIKTCHSTLTFTLECSMQMWYSILLYVCMMCLWKKWQQINKWWKISRVISEDIMRTCNWNIVIMWTDTGIRTDGQTYTQIGRQNCPCQYVPLGKVIDHVQLSRVDLLFSEHIIVDRLKINLFLRWLYPSRLLLDLLRLVLTLLMRPAFFIYIYNIRHEMHWQDPILVSK